MKFFAVARMNVAPSKPTARPLVGRNGAEASVGSVVVLGAVVFGHYGSAQLSVFLAILGFLVAVAVCLAMRTWSASRAVTAMRCTCRCYGYRAGR